MRKISLGLIVLFALASCTPPSIPIRITQVTASYPPLVGKTVDLLIELTSKSDESNVVVFIHIPDSIHSKDQEYRWDLSFAEDESLVITTEVCVLEAGAWAIGVSIASYFDNGEIDFGDAEVVGVVSKADSGEVLLEKDIELSHQDQFTQEPNEFYKKVEPSDCRRP
jgi:hypothetical protein